jgi:hypothetical protein
MQKDKLRQREKKQYLPAEKYSYLLLRFYDTYTYYIYTKNLLAVCSGSPAPYEYTDLRMTITFENNNDVIVYALQRIISYARDTQQIFVAQCVWWLASIISLEKGLIDYIDNIKDRCHIPVNPEKDLSERNCVTPTPRDIQEDTRPDKILKECEEFLRDSRRLRDIAALKSKGTTRTGRIHPTSISKKILKK